MQTVASVNMYIREIAEEEEVIEAAEELAEGEEPTEGEAGD